jgi:hypothetical protein
MSIAAGSLSLKRYQVFASPQKTPLAWISERLATALVSPLRLEDTQEESSGFCHPFSGDPALPDVLSLVYDDVFLFGLRFDKKSIPTTYLKLQLRAALESLDHAQDVGVKKWGSLKNKPVVGKKLRDSLKEKLKEELLRSTLPTVRLVEVLWHLHTNEIWVESTSAGILMSFEKLFLQTFEIPLFSLNPGTAPIDFARIHLGLPEDLQPLCDVTPFLLAEGQFLGREQKGRESVAQQAEKGFEVF